MKWTHDTLFEFEPVKKFIYLTTLILTTVLVLLFTIFWSTTNHYVQKNAHENLSFVIGRLQNDLDSCLADLKKCGERLAASENIQNFLSNDVRYLDTQMVINEFQATMAQSQYMTGAVIFDTEGYFYRYGNAAFSNEFLRSQSYAIPEKSGFSTMVYEDQSYLAYWQGIYYLDHTTMPHLGTVAALMPMTSVANLLNQYDINQDITLLLMDGDQVIISGGLGDSLPPSENTVYIESVSLRQKPYQLVVYLPRDRVFPYSLMLVLTGVMAIIFILGCVFYYLHRINLSVSAPIDQVVREICSISGSARSRIPLSSLPWLNNMIVSINQLLARVEDYSHRAFDTQQRLYEAELDKQKMDLYLLRKQINAHFAYNSLNTIHAIAAESGQKDIQMIATGLAQLMRYAYAPDEYINLFDEMQLIEQYVDIMNIRFNHKFQVNYNVDDRLCEYIILRQMIQPLVENALIHGLENKTENCILSITGEIIEEKSSFLKITVEDNGIGIEKKVLEKIQFRLAENTKDYSPSGIAMVNIHRRIQLYYGSSYGLHIDSVPGGGTLVSFTFPLISDPNLN